MLGDTRKHKKIVLLLLLFLASLLLLLIANQFPSAIEKYYSGFLYPHIAQILNYVSSFVTVSLGEIILLIIIIYLLYIGVNFFKKILSHRTYTIIFWKTAFVSAAVVGILYIGFLLIWGLNYYRPPIDEIAHLDTANITNSELVQICSELIVQANELREQIQEDNNGVMVLPAGKTESLSRAQKGYMRAGEILPELAGDFSNPKPVFLSEAMSYAGISGVYSPFTGEANVDIDIPAAMIPATACHEMAHQRGFAREDEANFIAYFACSLNPDLDFQYSGVLLALIYSMNNLATVDKEKYLELRLSYNDGLNRDTDEINRYWDAHEGISSIIVTHFNDLYLKANHQNEGVASYGNMVKLLIAERRAYLLNFALK